jgi:hypothetical protein
MNGESIEINLSRKYDLTDIDGMTIQALLTSLADAERMYKKVGMAGLAENAANAYQLILASIEKRAKNAELSISRARTGSNLSRRSRLLALRNPGSCSRSTFSPCHGSNACAVA